MSNAVEQVTSDTSFLANRVAWAGVWHSSRDKTSQRLFVELIRVGVGERLFGLRGGVGEASNPKEDKEIAALLLPRILLAPVFVRLHILAATSQSKHGVVSLF